MYVSKTRISNVSGYVRGHDWNCDDGVRGGHGYVYFVHSPGRDDGAPQEHRFGPIPSLLRELNTDDEESMRSRTS